MNPPFLPHSARILVAATVASALLLGISQVRGLHGERSANEVRLQHHLEEWQQQVSHLEAEAEQEGTFKPAFNALLNLVAMTECLEVWQHQAPVPAPADLNVRLQNAYLIARARAATHDQLRRMREVEARYEGALTALAHLPAGPAGGNPAFVLNPDRGSRG